MDRVEKNLRTTRRLLHVVLILSIISLGLAIANLIGMLS